MAVGRVAHQEAPPRAGQSLKDLYAQRRRTWAAARRRAVWLSAVWWGPALVALGVVAGVSTHYAFFGLLFAVLCFAAVFDVVFRQPDRLLTVKARAGAESSTGKALRVLELRGGTAVLHDRMAVAVPSPFEVEHLVIGPTGMFLIDTKHWQGGLKFLGASLYLGHANQDALFKDLLDRARMLGAHLTDAAAYHEEVGVVSIMPVLAIHAENLPGTPRKMQGVIVATPGQLAGIVRSPDIRWSPGAVSALIDTAAMMLPRKDATTAP